MGTLIEQLLTKLGLGDEPGVFEKTTELVRLLELRSANVPLQVNEYGKIVLCADLAAVMLGISFDKENALKLSGLRKTHYTNNKRLFEKLLDLNKIVGVNDICLQLGLNVVEKKADELLQLYESVVGKENPNVDISHPQYAAMAVYQACKLNKKRVSKTKIISFSNLRPSQWSQLETHWNKFIEKHYKDSIEIKKKPTAVETITNGKLEKHKLDKQRKNEAEDYLKWKKRMLEKAESYEKQRQSVKENIIIY